MNTKPQRSAALGPDEGLGSDQQMQLLNCWVLYRVQWWQGRKAHLDWQHVDWQFSFPHAALEDAGWGCVMLSAHHYMG